jgi:hypothetical protein
MNSKKIVSEMLKEGEHYEIVKDGTGYGYKYAILDSEIWAPKEGIVEIKRLKNNLTVDGRPKNDDEVIIKRYKDRETGLLFGLHTGVDDRTKAIAHNYVKLDGNMMFDLSIPSDRRLYIMAMRSPSVEGSPNQSGKPIYKIFDKQINASKNVDKRKVRQRAEAIVDSLKDDQLEEMALNIGVNVAANRNREMLLDEVYRFVDNDPRKFIDIFESPNRQYITIFNKARAKNIITLDYATNTFMYGGLLLGHSQDAAVNFLMEKENIAHSIKLQYEDIDAGTRQSMSFVKEQVVDPEKEALKKRIAELEAANATKEKMEAPVEVIETPEERFAKLKTKAKDLGIKGFALPHVTEEKLLKMIEEHESKLEQ